MGTFAIYQLYANLSARWDFISSAACLVVDFIAAAVCVGGAVLERQKSIEEAQVQQQNVPSKEGEEAETLPINQIKTAEDLATIRDIENKIAEKDAKLQQEQNAKNEEVLEWFNDQIVFFDATTQLALRNCAKLFVQTGEIVIEQKKIPPHIRKYNQGIVFQISSIFLLAGRSREQCIYFVHKVFANYFRRSNPEEFKIRMIKRIKGPKTMLEIMKESETS